MTVLARKVITLDEKIRRAEVSVAAAKYGAAPDELEKSVTKRKQLDGKKSLDVYHTGDRVADGIIGFTRPAAQKQTKKSDTG